MRRTALPDLGSRRAKVLIIYLSGTSVRIYVDENDLIGRVLVTRVGTGVWNYDSEKWACAFRYKTTR